MGSSRETIAVVGGGASGVLAAVHLSTVDRRPRRILLFEPQDGLGGGPAYSTDHPRHLLNVPARDMSAFEDRPDDFVDWLRHTGRGIGPDQFAPRRLYRLYLRRALARARVLAPRGTTISVVKDRVIDLWWPPGSTHPISLTTDGDTRHDVDRVVLAVGAPPPSLVASLGLAPGCRVVPDPWHPGALGDIPTEVDVLLVGTGLTMVDVALALGDGSPARTLYARSRTGHLPAVHEPDGFVAWPGLDLRDLRDARSVVRRFRQAVDDAERVGHGWRNVVSAFRHAFPPLWDGLPVAERRRLHRLVGRRWELHRHRMSQEAAHALDQMTRSGRLDVAAGRIHSVVAHDPDDRSCFAVTLRTPRSWETLRVGAIVDCTGPAPSSPGPGFLGQLERSGDVQRHPTGVGILTDRQGRPLDARGNLHARLYTIGWCRRGVAFESTAVPELRRQASEIARLVSLDGQIRTSTPLVPRQDGDERRVPTSVGSSTP